MGGRWRAGLVGYYSEQLQVKEEEEGKREREGKTGEMRIEKE
jgi:hypothetical protein